MLLFYFWVLLVLNSFYWFLNIVFDLVVVCRLLYRGKKVQLLRVKNNDSYVE